MKQARSLSHLPAAAVVTPCSVAPTFISHLQNVRSRVLVRFIAFSQLDSVQENLSRTILTGLSGTKVLLTGSIVAVFTTSSARNRSAMSTCTTSRGGALLQSLSLKGPSYCQDTTSDMRRNYKGQSRRICRGVASCTISNSLVHLHVRSQGTSVNKHSLTPKDHSGVAENLWRAKGNSPGFVVRSFKFIPRRFLSPPHSEDAVLR